MSLFAAVPPAPVAPPFPLFSPEAPYATLLLLVNLILVYRALPMWRRSLMNTLIFFVACLVGDGLATLLAGSMSGMAQGLRQLAVWGEGLAVIRFAGLALFNVILPRLHIRISGILGDILIIVGYIAWTFLRLNLVGVQLSHLFATSAVITAVLAISMQDTLGNLLGGLALQMDNSLEIGDWIRIDDISGIVTDIQWRYTALRTRSGEKVILPNSQLMKGRFVVLCDRHSPQPYWRRSIGFHVDLAYAPARVIAATVEDIVSARIANVADTPEPLCLLMHFGPGYAGYELRYWLIDPAPDEPTDSEVRIHILAALQRAGIRLAVSDQTVHLVQEGRAHREEVRQRELNRRLEALRHVELFDALSEEERQQLAERLVPAPFARGDILTRQGATAHWLYIMISGQAESWWQPEQGPAQLYEQRGPGSVFGELGLMLGQPRRATVVAVSDIEAYRLDKAGFEQIIRARPTLAASFSDILQRRLNHFEALEKGHAENRNRPVTSAEKNVLGQKILDFFGISLGSSRDGERGARNANGSDPADTGPHGG